MAKQRTRDLEWFERIALDNSLPPQAIRIAAVIAAAAAREGGTVTMPQKPIQEAVGCVEMTVTKSLRALERAGFLRIEARQGRCRPFSYTATFPGEEGAA